jgi:hypothetical protein
MLASKVAKLRTTANTSATNSIEPKVRRLAQFKFTPTTKTVDGVHQRERSPEIMATR